MTRSLIAGLTLLAIAATLPAGSGTPAATWQPASSSLPAWMAGCWAGERGGERFEERWIVADGSTLLAVANTTKEGEMTGFEFLRVIVRNGNAVYVAQPGGAPPTEFSATTMTSDRVVFENPAHDFPKRVVYQRAGDRLTASIDGGSESGKRIEFAMTREPCGE